MMNKNDEKIYQDILTEKVSAQINDRTSNTEYSRGYAEGLAAALIIVKKHVAPEKLSPQPTYCRECEFYIRNSLKCRIKQTYCADNEVAGSCFKKRLYTTPVPGNPVMVSNDKLLWYLKIYVEDNVVYDPSDPQNLTKWEYVMSLDDFDPHTNN